MRDPIADEASKAGASAHERIVLVAGLAGAGALVSFRMLIELGFAPSGAILLARVPLEYVWLLWYLALLAVALDRRQGAGAARVRSTVYEWWLGIVGLAGTIWVVQQLGLRQFVGSGSGVYPLASACSLAVFVSGSFERQPGLHMFRNVVPDLLRIVRRPSTFLCLLAAAAMLVAAPRSSQLPTEGPALERWYFKQVKQPIPAAWAARPVTLVELTDYQCPGCREAAVRYRDVIRRAHEKYGNLFAFVRVDFPLEDECNPGAGGLHPAACEAAASVRLARAQGTDTETRVVEWLWTNQAQLTRESVFDGMATEFKVDVRSRYPELVFQISREAAEGRRLGITGTPAYFLNGRRLPSLPAHTLEMAIAIEAGRALNGT